MDVMGLISGISQTANAYKVAVQTLDEAKITTATNELTTQLIHLGAEVLSLQKNGLQSTERERALLGRVHDLEDHVRELEKRISERDRYELVEDYPGTYALRIKEAARNGEPTHYLCPGCMDNNAVKSILQLQGTDGHYGTCSSCKSVYQLKADEPLVRHRDNW